VLDDDSCEMKHVALCYTISKCCVGRCISFVCDIEKHNGIYQNTFPVTAIYSPHSTQTAFEMWWHTRRNQISSFCATDESI